MPITALVKHWGGWMGIMLIGGVVVNDNIVIKLSFPV